MQHLHAWRLSSDSFARQAFQGYKGCCFRPQEIHSMPLSKSGKPVDRQAGLIVALEVTRVLGVVDQDGLQFAVSRQVSPQQEGETVLKCLKTWGRLLLPGDVCAVRHFFHCKPISSILNTCWGLYPPSSMMVLSSSGYEAAVSASTLLASPERLTLRKA